ncbi:MAG: DNA repair ATPase [Flavobacteriales bacterium]|nr:DNA repair ATPase [Flavobacteriales bacterium]
MSELENNNQEENTALEQGTYEIIKERLEKQGNILQEKLNQLNESRKAVFGTIQTQLIGNERIGTDNNCEARDMIPIGSNFLFGYNVHIGLKTETKLSDVFGYYSYANGSFKQESLSIIANDEFESEFQNLYKYYKSTVFTKFVQIGPFIYFIFQIGKSVEDIKAFKWQITNDNRLEYAGGRSEHEAKFPEQHEFTWKRATADNHRRGAHPHVSIEDLCFVETIGGDLTIKVEDNTETGRGIYAEPVDYANQTLDDAEILYAIVGELVILKILPYQEKKYRYFICNTKLQEAIRIDSLENACVLLPDDHGVIFPKGYYLHSGEHKLFDISMEGMFFEKKVASPNGEDFLYVFYNQVHGTYVLLRYNLIEQSLAQPIVCNGLSIFENGEMCIFKADSEPKKHHAIQIWQTPFYGYNYEVKTENNSYLHKVGNKEIVRLMANCNEVFKLVKRKETYPSLYIDIVRFSTDILDTYHWINHDEAFHIDDPLKEIKSSASTAIDEFEKVVELKKSTVTKTHEVEAEFDTVQRSIRSRNFDLIDHFVHALADLRKLRGNIISLKDLRYINLTVVDEMEKKVVDFQNDISQKCVKFLLTEKALIPFENKEDELAKKITQIKKVVEADQIDEEIKTVSTELDLLIQVVSNLDINDATETTKIIDNITDIYGRINLLATDLKKERKNLFSKEAKAEFGSQLKLINQSSTNYLNLSETPEKCEEYLNKLMIQFEELEGKYVDFPEFGLPLAEAREEVYNAFESKKITLLEFRNNKANALHGSADRIINGIKNRLQGFESVSDINGYYASDILVQKVRKIVEQLRELGDVVKADEIQSQLKSAKEDAFRQLRDRKELFVAGDDTIKFGNHHFSVNKNKLDVTIVAKNDQMCYHMTGTNFFSAIKDEKFESFKDLWKQHLISENNDVYRAEYLAYQLYEKLFLRKEKLVYDDVQANLSIYISSNEQEKLALIYKFMASKYDEGYTRGLHDHDAMLILDELIHISSNASTLTFDPRTRAIARFFWSSMLTNEERSYYIKKLKGAGMIAQAFQNVNVFDAFVIELQKLIEQKLVDTIIAQNENAREMANYLLKELSAHDTFARSKASADLEKSFVAYIKKNDLNSAFQNIKKEFDTLDDQFLMKKSWIDAYIRDAGLEEFAPFVEEYAIADCIGTKLNERIIDVKLDLNCQLKGEHRIIEDGKYHINFIEFINKLSAFSNDTVVRFKAFQDYKHALIEQFRKSEKLSEFEPKVMNSFVRNELIDKVYLPLIGNNLAKQMGTAGEDKRIDLMGLLLLISPPGYGKTTLMEYISNRLGLIFMKINGPTIGHEVTSVDPASANNSATREELEKLNLSFEMGDNVMIYLDDIQHCNPEFLQKFISLCDAQRKIEGVYKGQSKTYDFKGKRVVIVMAGNPYTESGSKFKIPDMLANRADIYNLGDIIGGQDDSFQNSYIENCITSNAILTQLATKSTKDVQSLIGVAKTGDQSGLTLEANHSPQELSDYVELLKKVVFVRDVVFKVNMAYIESASQNDKNRVEPKFQLQGSYRDMNKIVEKLVPIMNQEELETIILSHYKSESQTLTSGAESNLLKFKSMMEWLTEAEVERREQILEQFALEQKIKGLGEDNTGAQIAIHLEELVTRIQSIENVFRGKPEILDTPREEE